MEEILLRDYLKKNNIKDGTLVLYDDCIEPHRIAQFHTIPDFIKSKEKKGYWFFVKELERSVRDKEENTYRISIKKNPTKESIDNFIAYLLGIYKNIRNPFAFIEDYDILGDFHLSIVYSRDTGDLQLRAFLDKNFVLFYKTVGEGAPLNLEVIGDKEYITVDCIKESPRDKEFNCFSVSTLKENFLKEGGDMDWVKS